MKHLSRIVVAGMLMLLIAALVVPVAAQDEPTAASGAPLILGNFGADPATFNPILSNDGTSNTIISRIFPGFIGLDDDTGFWAPGADQALVVDWTVSEDNLVYTFTLRDDLLWSDGTPVTSADVQYFWDSVQDPSVNLSGSFVSLRDIIANVESPDATTVVVTFNSPDCNAIDSAGALQVVPAHYYSQIFPERSDMNDSEENLNPAVTAGPWDFLNFRPGEQVTLASNTDWVDGVVVPQGWIFKNVADQTVLIEQFLVGQLTQAAVPTARIPELGERVDNGEFNGHYSTRANTRFLSFNMADPNNPQPALDEEGNRLDQGQHPIFGGYTLDGVATPGGLKVRQALNYGMNFEELNTGVFAGLGIQMPTHSRPDDWAFPTDLEVYPYDPDMANQLLDEAGWVDEDGDGVRECVSCDYLSVDPAFAGSPLQFELLTNAGNTSQEALGVLLQDQWGRIGARVDFSAIDFNVLVDDLTGQTYDAIMIFWNFGFPFDPDGITSVFSTSADIPVSGFNTGSYYNARVDELLDTARALPGCDIEERKALYGEAYTILHDESPWIWIGIGQTLAVGQLSIEGWDPKPQALSETLWNEETWFVAP